MHGALMLTNATVELEGKSPALIVRYIMVKIKLSFVTNIFSVGTRAVRLLSVHSLDSLHSSIVKARHLLTLLTGDKDVEPSSSNFFCSHRPKFAFSFGWLAIVVTVFLKVLLND